MANSKNKPKGFNLAGTNKKYGFRTVPNDSVPWRLQSADGKYFGDVSYDAYKAVEGGTLDSYKAKNDDEKNIIAEYRNYPGIALKSQNGADLGKVTYDGYVAISNGNFDSYTPKSDDEKAVFEAMKKEPFIPFSIEIDGETKDFGSISYNAYKAIENGNIESYEPANDSEKKAIGNYKSFVEEYAKKQREPEGFWQGLAHGTGYTLEKIGAGAVDGISDAGSLLLAGGAHLGRLFTWGSWDKALKDYAGNQLAADSLGDLWDGSIESRYRVPDWYREYLGTTAYNFGSLVPALAAEYFTASASPLLETNLAGMAGKTALKGTVGSAAKTITSKLIKPKASDVVFGLSAAGSAAKAGYAQSGDVGKSLQYGVLNGLGEVATEKLFGGLGGTGIGADDLIDLGKVKGLSKIANNKYGKRILSVGLEGVEEMIMAEADPIFQRITVNPNAEFADFKDLGESAFQGILLSAFSNVATLPVRTYQKTKAINILNKTTEGINALMANDADKFEPLKYTATEAEIEARQKQIKVFSDAYAEIAVNDVISSNPDIAESVKVEASSTAENPLAQNVDTTEPVSAETEQVKESIDENPTAVSVGDTFKDTKTGNTITVVERDAENTTVEIDTGKKQEQRTYTNAQADTLLTNAQFEQVDSSETLSPEDAQKYNIVVSNLKKKAEELGLLDNNFFTALQNVNLYNPTANDRALISREFRRVFAGNTDTLVTNWLNAISVEEKTQPKINKENISVANVEEEIPQYKLLDDLGLTYEEKSAILKYKSGDSYIINEKLYSNKDLSKEETVFVANLNNALDKLPTYTGTVYRNIGFYFENAFETFVKEHLKNTEVAYPSFTSASKVSNGYTVEDMPYKVHYKINSKNAKDVSEIGLTKENEVLFKTDSTYNILDTQLSGNVFYILCEEVTGNEITNTDNDRRIVDASLSSDKRQSLRKGGQELNPDISNVQGRSGRVLGISEEQSDGNRGRSEKSDDRNNPTDEQEVGNRGVGEGQVLFADSDRLYENLQRKREETPESVTEPTESVIKKADSVTETPDTESAVPYTDREKQNWESSNTIIVYESDEQFEAFVEKVLNNEDTHKKIYFGKIPDATAQMVLDKTGVDVSGHNIALKGYEIRKILLNSHGDEEAEATRGQEPITTDDLKNIPSVITNPDDVNLSDKEYEGKPALLFEKTIDGKNYVVAYVSRKHHDIAIQTMYKKRSLATAENADALSSTPETTSSTASNNIVSQDNDIVNSSIHSDEENDTFSENVATNVFKITSDGKRTFNQLDIDYTDNTLRDGEFRVMGNKDGRSYIKTVKGKICGYYGMYKNSNNNFVVSLASGLEAGSFATETEAEQFMMYANEYIGNFEVNYNSNGYPILNENYKIFHDMINNAKESKAYITEKNTPISENVVDNSQKNGIMEDTENVSGGAINERNTITDDTTNIRRTETGENIAGADNGISSESGGIGENISQSGRAEENTKRSITPVGRSGEPRGTRKSEQESVNTATAIGETHQRNAVGNGISETQQYQRPELDERITEYESDYFGTVKIKKKYFSENSKTVNKTATVQNGQTRLTYAEIDKSEYTPEMLAIADKNNRFGVKTVFTVGETLAEHNNGRVQHLNGGYVDGTIYINANLEFDLTDVATHELTHYMLRKVAEDKNIPFGDYISDVRFKFTNYMYRDKLENLDDVVNAKVEKSYQNPKDYTYDDEFLADMSYLIHHDEAKEWFFDYEAALKVFEDLENEALGETNTGKKTTAHTTDNKAVKMRFKVVDIKPTKFEIKKSVVSYGNTKNSNSIRNDTTDADNSITQNDTPVNSYSMQNSENYSFEEYEIAVSTEQISQLLTDKNNARKVFVDYARANFPKSVLNSDTKKEIGISRLGIDKFLSGNFSKEKFATGYKIPELIKSAVKVGEAENKKGKSGINGYEYFDNTILIDGKIYAVHIRVRNTDMGDKYYGHTISKSIENIEIEPLAWNSEDNASVHSINASDSFNDSITQNDTPVNSYSMQNSENNAENLEGEENNEQGKGLLHDGSRRRNTDKRAGRKAGRLAESRIETNEISFEERQEYTKKISDSNLETKLEKDGVGRTHRYTEIKETAWNDNMREIADYYKKFGITVVFSKGDIEISTIGFKKFARGLRRGNKIIVSYDNASFSPNKIAKHEYIHAKYTTLEVQKAKKDILSNMSDEEYNNAINYLKRIYRGVETRKSALEEELICNVLSGMYSTKNNIADIVNSFWIENDSNIKGYDVSQYAKSIDAGGDSQQKSYGGADYDYSNTTRKVYNDRAWAYTLLSNEDINLLNEKYYEYFKTNAHPKSKLSGGKTRIIEVNNKLLFVSGTYNNPVIEAVLAFNTDNATDMEVLKLILFSDVNDNDYSRYSFRGIKNETQIFTRDEEVKSFDFYERTVYTTVAGENGRRATLEDDRKAFGYTGSFTIRDGIYRKDESGVSYNSKSISISDTNLSSQEYSLSPKWYPDLSGNQLSKLNEIIKRDVKTSIRSVTDTANWLFTTIGNTKVFAIYSTENTADPTLLYESKGKNAEKERDILLDLLEGIEYGESSNGKSVYVNWVSGSGWLQKSNGVAHSNGTMARRSSNQNVGVLQGQSKRKPSRAFESVIENLFEIQGTDRRSSRYERGNRGINYSIDDKDNIYLPYNEYRQLREYIISKNNNGEKLNSVDCKEIGDNFYIWKNNSKTDFKVTGSIPIVGNEDFVNGIRRKIENGTYRTERDILRTLDRIDERGEYDNRSSIAPGNERGNLRNGGLSQEKSSGDKTDVRGRRSFGESVGNTPEDEIKYSIDDTGVVSFDDIMSGRWQELIDEYGFIEQGEKPTRDIKVPNRTSETQPVSRFARTMMEAGLTPDFAMGEFEKAILDGRMTYMVVQDKDAREFAVSKIKNDGYKEALRDWEIYVKDGILSKNNMALGQELYNQAITNKDVETAMKIAADLSVLYSEAGQVVQSARMLKTMGADGQLYYLEKSIKKINEEYQKKLKDKFKDIELDENLIEEFLTAKDTETKDAVYDKICQNIADQIPATIKDKFNAWRYLAMLGNTRTHSRNLIGNVSFWVAIKYKNLIRAVGETVATKAGKLDTSERTTSLFKDRKAKEFAKNDFPKIKKSLMNGGSKYAETGDINEKRTIFKTKWLEALRKANFKLLEAEDGLFLSIHYKDALARIITARNIDVDFLNSGSLEANQLLEEIQAFAIKEAQIATFRDANVIADGISRIERKISHSDNKVIRSTGILIEGVMPFKKTPLNIAKQGVTYSPVGLVNGIYKMFHKIENGKIDVAGAIDELSKGFAGTSLILLAFLMRGLGWLVGDDDKNKASGEKAFDKMMGEQNFAFKIGDKSYTIDWMIPTALPLFIGANLYDLAQGEDMNTADVVNAMTKVADPLLELSVFSGLSDLIQSAQYNDGNAITAIATDVATSYITQAVPTLGGQITRIIDKTKRNYYYKDANSELPDIVENLVNKVSSKIPGISYLFEPSVDNWGREETYGNIFERIIENTVSPGYYSESEYTAVDKELKRLYEKTGNTDVFPKTQSRSFTFNGEKINLNAKQYTDMKKLRGQKSFNKVRDVIKGSQYKAMDDDEKIAKIEKCYKEAYEEAKHTVFPKTKEKIKK